MGLNSRNVSPMRHLLGIGFLTHASGFVLAMLPRLEVLGGILYLIAAAVLIAAIAPYREAPLKEPRFYGAALSVFVPLAGPVIALQMVRSGETRGIADLFRVHPALLFVWGIILTVAIAVTFIREDRYFDAARTAGHAIP